MTRFWAERALLPEGVAAGVVLESGDDGRLSAVRSEAAPAPAGAVARGGLVLPGLADQHSHAYLTPSFPSGCSSRGWRDRRAAVARSVSARRKRRGESRAADCAGIYQDD